MENFEAIFFISVGSDFGLGHWRRMQSVAKILEKQQFCISFKFFLFGTTGHQFVNFENLLKVSSVTCIENINEINALEYSKNHIVIIDLHPSHIDSDIEIYSKYIKLKNSLIIAIDHAAVNTNISSDIRWVPSFYKNPQWPQNLNIECGWTTYLLDKKLDTEPLPETNSLLVLTGGSDTQKLGNIWPFLIDRYIDKALEIKWVKGPFASYPTIPKQSKHNFTIYDAPRGIDDLINKSDWVLTVYGVSVFESLMYGRTCIVFNPYSDQNKLEMDAFENENIVYFARDDKAIIDSLKFCVSNSSKVLNYEKGYPIIDGLGAQRLVELIKRVMRH